MKTSLPVAIQNHREKPFEQKVFKLLSINPTLFNKCVKEHRGYALLLRIWIEEKYHNGSTALEVAEMIKKSKLRIEAIKAGRPLHIAV
ncbi:hypothetical protein ATE84_2293 [Aquimarina sp. MAR_2010_214]|uniref:hypothetical protein n=1 Tax=Aquimarina sp. MAR_2010_214 TaxID=1250026 RepID=UPI000C7054B3|nr:hypothetical protein [Aquimarina sp. MAR_2010_214]PKV50238.1 hypothetical protein ATE84_2293 [Aquimarina sp. MAR_2010_214]